MARGLLLKLFAIGFMTLIILGALFSVGSVISSRQSSRDEAVNSIAESYSRSQVLVGPVLIRPFTETTHTTETNEKGVKKIVSRTEEGSDVTFPHEYAIKGVLVPSERRHGLYKVPVYEMQGQVSGTFEIHDLNLEGTLQYGAPYLAFSVSDVRGIVGTPRTVVNGEPVVLVHGGAALRGWTPKLMAPLRLSDMHGRLNFALDLVLAGTESLGIAPVGDSNHVELQSSWPSPLFSGSFLPRTREVGRDGFRAAWDLSSLASQTQTQMQESGKDLDLLTVNLTTVIDPYKLSDRAVKYGLLFVLLTFGGFFLFESMKHLPIHPIQYLLVGFGLTIFFLLLISLSEHMAFALAYLVASAACIGLLTFYLTFVLRSIARGFSFGAMLALLYGCIYGLLVSEDNALVLGSLMLFAILAGVMFVTRRVDWYSGSGAVESLQPAPAVSPPAASSWLHRE